MATTIAARRRRYSIDQATQAQLRLQQAQAAAVAQKYPTVAAAEAAGYAQSTPFVPCIGAHYTNIGLVGAVRSGQAVRAALRRHRAGLADHRPELPRVPSGWRARRLRRSERPLAPAQRQRWPLLLEEERHRHRRRAADARTSAPRSAASKRELPDIWMLHDWVVPGWACSWGVFAPECPELGGKAGAPDAWTS